MTKKFFLPAIFIIALFALSHSDASSQTMYFAEGVDKDGYPITESSVFNISSSGGYLYILTRLPYNLDCKSVKYIIYRNGEYDNTIYQDTEYDWTWFWKKITFYKTGRYTVYLYDCYDELITSGNVRINFK
jgi:hypothetical protein